jgi:serine/threonine protein kinase/tetratricopeptide (TPR) repeat protein
MTKTVENADRGEIRTLADRYVLGDLIGRGGMGAVYAAHDEWEQRGVAVKLIKNRRASEGRAWRMFSRELRAVLKLDHPGIVSVYDYGIDEAGLPFFVMERVPGMTLDELPDERLRWMDIVDVFEQVLETLAYAHARGVIHRDVKPENFIIAPGEGRPRIKLVDFGIAKLMGEATMERRSPEKAAETLTELAKNFTLSDEATVGTPAYMAPELGLNEVHLIGPQTDLYSLGCMLYEFVSGQRPFDARNVIGLIMAHCTAPRPRVRRRDGTAVPDELERLVASLLEKSPRRRQWCAADVLEQLHRVPDFQLDLREDIDSDESRVLPRLLEQTGDAPSGVGEAATGADRELRGRQLRADGVDEDAATVQLDPNAKTLADSSMDPTVPVYRESTPEADHSDEFEPPLFVTRLGVAALRLPRMVGREAEQSWLMGHARATLRSGKPRLMLLRGIPGIGRGRLARWVGAEFAERGACRVLTLTYDDDAAEHDVLRQTLRDMLGVGEGDDVRAALEKHPYSDFLSAPAVAAGFLAGDDLVGEGGQLPVGVLAELFNLVRRQKPLLLIVENLERSLDQKLPRFLLDVLRRGADWPWPIFMVATVDSRDRRADFATDLSVHPACHTTELGALTVEQGRELLQSLLPLRDAAAERLSEYAGGSPDVMLQMLRALATAGDVYASGGQYWVKPGAWDDLSHIDDAYAAGVERLLAGLGEERGSVALIASLVGMEPDTAVLEDVLDRLGLELDPGEMVDEMLEEGIFVGTENGGVRFAHALMHEAWQEHARGRPEYRRWQRAIGRTLEYRDAGKGRIGLHLYESGDDDALAFLLEGGQQALQRGEFALASRYLKAMREAARDVELDVSTRVALGAGLGRLAIRRSGRDLYEDSLSLLEDLDEPAAVGWRSWIDGAWADRSGRFEEAREAFSIAIEAFERIGDDPETLRARESLADTLRKSGEYADAEQEAQGALALAEALDAPGSQRRLLGLLGFICLETERYERAVEFARRAREQSDDEDRSALARSFKIECGALMRLERVDEAFDLGKDALTIFREVGDAVGELSMLNLLAMLRHETGAHGQARQYAREALERSRQIGEQALRGRVLNNLAHACEELGRTAEAYDAYMGSLRWSHDNADPQNEARVCFNLARVLRNEEPSRAIVLVERSRRILDSLDLPYVRESERVLDEIRRSHGDAEVDRILATYEERFAAILEASRGREV